MENTIDLAFKLHEMLLNSNEFLTLKKYEKIMLEDFNSASLISSYHKLQEKYTTIKTNETLKELHEAKLKMDNDLNVINYKKAYKDYQILVGNITDIVFEGFKNDTLVDKILKIK